MTHTDSTDPVQVRRAYRLRAYPTRPQESRAVKLLRDHCDLYNAALQERRDAWRRCNVRISYSGQSAQLKEIRAADPDGQGRHSFTAQQQTLRRLNAAFQAFFRRAHDAKHHQRKAGYPRFKPYQRFNQVLFVAGDGAKWEPANDGRWAYARFQAVGRIKVKRHRQIVGCVKTLQLKRENRRRDFHHKTARMLVNSFDAVALEELRVVSMTASATGSTVEPGTKVAAKSGLNRTILDAGWAQLTRILAAKAESAGRRTTQVNRRWTSVTCHACGARCSRPRQDTVVCPSCGEWDADVDGARNIATRAGLGSGQAPAA